MSKTSYFCKAVKIFVSILLGLSILLQSSGLVMYQYLHHHHCNDKAICSDKAPECIPENDDCEIAQKVKSIADKDNPKEDNKKETAASLEYICLAFETKENTQPFLQILTADIFFTKNTAALLNPFGKVDHPPPNC